MNREQHESDRVFTTSFWVVSHATSIRDSNSYNSDIEVID